MNIKNGLFSLFSLSALSSYFSSSARAATLGKRYHMLVEKGSEYFSALSDFSHDVANTRSIEFDQHHFISVTLTNEQAEILAEVVTRNGGIFEGDTMFTLSPVTDMSATDVNAKTTTTSAATQPTIITSIPKYSGTLYGQDVAIMDAQIFPNVAMLQGYNLTLVYSYVGDTPCIAHGTNVAEVIAQMFDPTKTDLRFLNFAVFDCNSQAFVGGIGEAISAIIKYKKGPGKDRGLTVNFSGAGPYSTITNALFKQLTDIGITVVVAAGNSNEPCNLNSPASASSTIPLQSIGATQDQGRASYSNYATRTAHCVDLYLPGCLPMSNPWTGVPYTGCGTSFAAPLESGRIMVYKQSHPKATPAQIKQAVKQDSVTISINGTTINSITADMVYTWKNRELSAKSLNMLAANTEVNQNNDKEETIIGNLRGTLSNSNKLMAG